MPLQQGRGKEGGSVGMHAMTAKRLSKGGPRSFWGFFWGLAALDTDKQEVVETVSHFCISASYVTQNDPRDVNERHPFLHVRLRTCSSPIDSNVPSHGSTVKRRHTNQGDGQRQS